MEWNGRWTEEEEEVQAAAWELHSHLECNKNRLEALHMRRPSKFWIFRPSTPLSVNGNLNSWVIFLQVRTSYMLVTSESAPKTRSNEVEKRPAASPTAHRGKECVTRLWLLAACREFFLYKSRWENI